jgi:hypothetical protein
MRDRFFRLILVVFIGAAAPLFLADEASAQYREFIGRVDKVSKKKLMVDNRQGDKVPFVNSDVTTVSGEGKKEWKQIKKGDWVSVSWKMMDKPRIAYKVMVLPPRDEAGEDE